MKKIIVAIFLIVNMLLTSVTVFSEEMESITNRQREKIDLLYRLGVLTESETTSEPVTRGEFAGWLSALCGMSKMKIDPVGKFSDVVSGSADADAVSVVYFLGCMNGISATEFGVDLEITLTDAMVAITRLLGYEVIAQGKGGYPAGYNLCALDYGLLEDTDSSNSRVNIQVLCYNALFAPMMTMDGTIDRNTILLESVHNVYHIRGQVTATAYAHIGLFSEKINQNQIMIDNTIYFLGETAYSEYLGERVSCYYLYDPLSGFNTVIYMQCLDTKKLVVKAEDIISAQNGVLTYEITEEHTRQAKLATGFDFVYNHGTFEGFTINDLLISDGELTLIDTDGDNQYDVVKAMELETLIYYGCDLSLGKIYSDSVTLDFDTNDTTTYCRLVYVDSSTGVLREASISELGVGDAMSVCRSLDGRYILIYTTSARASGVINEIGDEEIVIDGMTYDLPLITPVSELEPGMLVEFSLDIYGRLVKLEDGSVTELTPYGYFFAYEDAKNLSAPRVMILTGSEALKLLVSPKCKVDDMAVSNLKNHPALFSGGVAKRQLVRYNVNGNNEVTNIYTVGGTANKSISSSKEIDPSVAVSSQKRYYYPYFKVLSGEDNVGKYKITDDTFFLLVPGVGDESENPDLYTGNYTFRNEAVEYAFNVYDVNENNEAGAVLLFSDWALEGQENVTKDTKRAIFVKYTIGVENPYVYLYEEGSIKRYEANAKYLNTAYLSSFSFGDAVYYVKAGSGLVTTLGWDMDVSDTNPDENNSLKHKNSDPYWQSFYGRVYKKLDDALLMVSAENNSSYALTGVDSRVVVPKNANEIALVDMKSKTISRVSYNNLPGAWESGAYVYTRIYKWNNTAELFVYKY